MPRWTAGVDGCRAGWIAALRDLDRPGEVRVRVVPRLVDVVDAPESPLVVAVDVPIGLPDRIVGAGRGPEALVRPRLGPLRRSVFSIPSRAAVYAETGPWGSQGERIAAFKRACAVARGTSEPPSAFSIQAFGILPKIREADALLRARPALQARLFEVHPELAFRTLNGEPLGDPKKTPEGLRVRRSLLAARGIPREACEMRPPRGADPDDLLDALADLVVAGRILEGAGRPLPDPPGRDGHGIPVAIWTFRP